jgi:hypothetical protein
MPLYEATARLTAGIALSASGRQVEGLAQLEQAQALAIAFGANALSEVAAHEHHRIVTRTDCSPPTPHP